MKTRKFESTQEENDFRLVFIRSPSTCCWTLWGWDCGVRVQSGMGTEETGVLCFYLRDCNNNHTSATGLVASIILSTVEQKCMGVKTILVWVCV